MTAVADFHLRFLGDVLLFNLSALYGRKNSVSIYEFTKCNISSTILSISSFVHKTPLAGMSRLKRARAELSGSDEESTRRGEGGKHSRSDLHQGDGDEFLVQNPTLLQQTVQSLQEQLFRQQGVIESHASQITAMSRRQEDRILTSHCRVKCHWRCFCGRPRPL